ncbi:hypothetical protein EW026_g602 [Hermanssonia centrifuga]|uniref:RlpA-like protein double-psi beta-barrel domain-containing protein n=1 Tax=Hermanssonia centrifuga TaxID=98765 RepID=A0A4S4KUL1_9APHY|nr:hypothetical protein EW026_g602 [Hermanssonia centrifuga]
MFAFATCAQILAVASLGFSFSEAHPTAASARLSKRFEDVPIYKSQGLGSACGAIQDDLINHFALSPEQWDSGNNCGKSATISYNGTKVFATVVSECQHCSSGSISLNPYLFEQLVGSDSVNVVYGDWAFPVIE